MCRKRSVGWFRFQNTGAGEPEDPSTSGSVFASLSRLKRNPFREFPRQKVEGWVDLPPRE